MNARCQILPYPSPWRDDPSDDGPSEQPDFEAPEIDDSWPLEIDDDALDALALDDDYEPQPERGDFWTEQDAA